MDTQQQVPSSDVDIFGDEVLEDPYPYYAELREMGRAVRLTRYDVWALPGYDEVWQVQRRPEMFSSIGGPGLNYVEDPMMTGVVLSSDPPDHSRYRKILNEKLSARALQGLRDDIEERADRLVAEVVSRGSFDAVADLAAPFPVDVVADLVGFPKEGRERFLAMADAAFNTFGPMNERTQAGMPVVMGIFEYLSKEANRQELAPGSWGAAIYDAVDRGEIHEGEAISLMSAYLVAGMDTTVNAVSSAIWLFAKHPDQWAALRADPSLAPNAFEETIRLESPVQNFFRGLTGDAEFGGIRLQRGDRIMMLLGSANRDPRRWGEDADAFDITRDTVGHVGFGGGTHRCAGMFLARMEGAALLSSLARQAGSIQFAGEPTRRLNHVIRGLASLPVTVEPSGA
jgi:cytochrome P450